MNYVNWNNIDNDILYKKSGMLRHSYIDKVVMFILIENLKSCDFYDSVLKYCLIPIVKQQAENFSCL